MSLIPNAFQEVACPPDQLEVEAVGALFFSDERPLGGVAGLLDWRLGGQITSLLLSGTISGRRDEQVLLRSNGKIRADWVLLYGAGNGRELASLDWQELLRAFFHTVQQSGLQRVALGLHSPAGLEQLALARMVRLGWQDLGEPKPQCLLSFDRSWLHA